MRIGANFPEKKETWMNSVYFKFVLFGIFLAAVLISGMKIIVWLIQVAFDHWLWMVGFGIALLIIKWWWGRRKR